MQVEGVVTNGHEHFFDITNTDGKRWLIPSVNTKTALGVYQPSGTNGKLFKGLFPIVCHFKFLNKVLHVSSLNIRIETALRNLILRTFNIDNFDYSFFLGTPGPRQKMTIQVFQRDKILGYVKLSRSRDIAKSFEHESEILNELRAKGIENVSESMYKGCLDGIYIFIQSSSKTNKSFTSHRWTKMHDDCLSEIVDKTKKCLRFEDTDYWNVIHTLQKEIGKFEEKDRKALTKGIEIVSNYYAQTNEYCFFHGDFTPWNMYIENNRLYLFDLEYSHRSFPPYMDMIHFVMQVCIQVKHLNEEQIISEIERSAFISDTIGRGHHITIIAYLLFVLSLYMRLFAGKFNSNDNGYRIWTSLLKYYIEL